MSLASKMSRRVTHKGTFLVISEQVMNMMNKESIWDTGQTAVANKYSEVMNGQARDRGLHSPKILVAMGYKFKGILNSIATLISYGVSLIRKPNKIKNRYDSIFFPTENFLIVLKLVLNGTNLTFPVSRLTEANKISTMKKVILRLNWGI